MTLLKERIILDGAEINRILNRIAHEVIERNKGIKDMAIIGIRRCGVHLADRLAMRIKEIEGHEILRGILDITLYRDDLSGMREQPVVNSTEIPFPVNGKRIILVDDVLFTGRTVRAALDNVMDFGRPLLIQLAVLIDRGHRELPISADYIGKALPTSRKEKVKVLLREEGDDDRVIIYGT